MPMIRMDVIGLDRYMTDIDEVMLMVIRSFQVTVSVQEFSLGRFRFFYALATTSARVGVR